MLDDETRDRAQLHTALRIIRRRVPDAVTAHLETSDQSYDIGFVLTDVIRADGRCYQDGDPAGWWALTDEVDPHLADLRWDDVVVGEDCAGHAALAVPPVPERPRRYQLEFIRTLHTAVQVDADSPEQAIAAVAEPRLDDGGGWQFSEPHPTVLVTDPELGPVLLVDP